MARKSNATNLSNTAKEEKNMKKASATTTTKNTTKEEKNMNKAVNTVTINGVQIPLTEGQANSVLALLLAGAGSTTPEQATEEAAPTPKKAATRKAAGKKAEPEKAKVEKKVEDFSAFAVKADGNHLSFTSPDGKFLYQKAARQALNNRLKAVCESKGLSVKYNKDFWAWEVMNPRTGKAPGKTVLAGLVKELSAPVPAAAIQAVYNQWEEAKIKRAAK